MSARCLSIFAAGLAVCLLGGACGSVRAGAGPTPTTTAAAAASPGSSPPRASATSGPLLDWPEFGLDPQRSDVGEGSSALSVAQLSHLRRVTVRLAGTIDSSPIYLHDALVAGRRRAVIVVTSTYGRTFAIDAASDAIVWTFTPPGYASWAGSAQITTASPVADPDGTAVYAASPDGLIHKLSLASGREEAGWPARITREPHHEKIAAALNLDGPDVIAATGGYFGDAPPYQGHVVLVDRASGRLVAVFNTLCAGRRALQQPSTCAASDSAVLSRGGAVVEPGGGRILIDTGNGPWNGTSDFGDSVLELSFPSLRLRQAFTPRDQQQLNSSDTDLGSSAPALLGSDRVLVAGKDGILRVLDLARLDGSPPTAHARERLGGEVQRLSTPGGGELFTQPAVWRRGGHTTVFVADEAGTAAYVLRGGRLARAWENGSPGTSPVMAGGLLYVFDPLAGGIRVYAPGSPSPLAELPGRPGHWNSPIVVDGHVIEPEGNANDHLQSGMLDVFSP